MMKILITISKEKKIKITLLFINSLFLAYHLLSSECYSCSAKFIHDYYYKCIVFLFFVFSIKPEIEQLKNCQS